MTEIEIIALNVLVRSRKASATRSRRRRLLDRNFVTVSPTISATAVSLSFIPFSLPSLTSTFFQMHSFLLLIFAVLDVQLAHGLKFSFQARTMHHSRSLRTRTDITGQTVNSSNGSVPIANTQNAEYISNITLGGVTIPVMLDTGRYGSTGRSCTCNAQLIALRYSQLGSVGHRDYSGRERLW